MKPHDNINTRGIFLDQDILQNTKKVKHLNYDERMTMKSAGKTDVLLYAVRCEILGRDLQYYQISNLPCRHPAAFLYVGMA